MGQWVSTKSVSEDDLVDLHGKVAIVTGGNTGVGYATIQFLTRKGAKVYMAARNESRALAAIEQLNAEDMADGNVHWLKLDLSDPRLAKQAAEEFLHKEKRLDILVNNAVSKSIGPYKLDKDGLLDVMVTNHISHFTFTDTLLPLLKATSEEEGSDVRIVNLSSRAHARVRPESFIGKESLNKNFGDSPNGYLDTYGTSKLANILHIKELQRRLDSENIPITCLAVHPGLIKTIGSDAFFSNLPYVGNFITRYISPMCFGLWRDGAMNSSFAAASSEVRANRDHYKGVYLTPVARITTPSKYALDERLAVELWETTQEVIRELGA